MNKEKQIEEMAEYIFGNAITHDTRFKEDCRSIAIDLYNANYRKQSEGEWIEERYIDEKRSDFKCSVCEYDDTFYRNSIHRFYKYCPYCGAKMKGGAE